MTKNDSVLLSLPDQLLHIDLLGGQARVLLCRTTQMARAAAKIHQPTSVALAALSRLMTGTAILSLMMKDDTSSVTVTVAGNGPSGKLTAVGMRGRVKVAVEHPSVDLPPKADGHLDVGGYIGHQGRMSVVKDMGFGEPYIGQTELVSGELGEDFARYFTVSEQQPSLVALGALVHEGFCLSAGGILVQPLPGCTEETLEQLEVRSMLFSSISREVADAPLEELYPAWFDGLEPKLLEVEPVKYECDCSRDKMAGALIALGRKELEDIIKEDGKVELTCHFCRTARQFSKEELKELLEKATRA